MKIFQIDAFTKRVFHGNPAAVVPLDSWLDDATLQSIAAENNLAETAFLVAKDSSWELRWFTPTAEVALCGHATLAAAHVLIHHLDCIESSLAFETRESGTLTVNRVADGSLSMSFPAIPIVECDKKYAISDALGDSPVAVFYGRYSSDQMDYVALFESEESIAALKPDMSKFKHLESRGVIATAPGQSCDFVSRYFAPNFGIDEDPVTGSAHCLLTPHWSKVLGKPKMQAHQLSSRGGEITCEMSNDGRVILTGHSVDYLTGEINY